MRPSTGGWWQYPWRISPVMRLKSVISASPVAIDTISNVSIGACRRDNFGYADFTSNQTKFNFRSRPQ